MSSAMLQDDALYAILAPLRRSDKIARVLTAILIACAVALAVASALRLAVDWQGAAVLALALGAGLVVFGFTAFVLLRRVPAVRTLALRADRANGTGERLVTALDLAPPPGGNDGVFAKGLRSEIATLAGTVSLRDVRTGSEKLLAFAVIAMLAAGLLTVFAYFTHAPSPVGSAAGSSLPTASDIAVLASEIAADPFIDEETANQVAASLDRLADGMTPDGLSQTEAAQLAELLDTAVQAHAAGQTMAEGGGVAPSIMPDAIGQWAQNDAIVFDQGDMGEPRTFARPMMGLEMTPAAEDDDDGGARPETVSPSAAAQVDDMPVEIDAPVSQTESRSEEGTSSFVPPNLIEGDPRAAQAIDLAGAGEAERQESMTSTAGRGAGLPMEDAPLPFDSTRRQIMELTQIIPMEGQRVRYYVEPDGGTEGHEGVTLGILPSWPAIVPAPVHRSSIPQQNASAVARFFDRTQDVQP